MKTVKLTLDPTKEIEVGDAEFLDLERWGLLVPEEASTEVATPSKPVKPKTPEV